MVNTLLDVHLCHTYGLYMLWFIVSSTFLTSLYCLSRHPSQALGLMEVHESITCVQTESLGYTIPDHQPCFLSSMQNTNISHVLHNIDCLLCGMREEGIQEPRESFLCILLSYFQSLSPSQVLMILLCLPDEFLYIWNMHDTSQCQSCHIVISVWELMSYVENLAIPGDQLELQHRMEFALQGEHGGIGRHQDCILCVISCLTALVVASELHCK